MAETLAGTLNKPLEPFDVVGQVSRGSGIKERGQLARQALEPTMRAEEEARSEARRLEREGAEKVAQKEVDLAQGEVRAIESGQRAYTQAVGKRPVRNVQDFNPDAAMELAALTAIMGAFVGLSGGGGRGALAALEGVTTGYKEGQQDLYDRQVAIYESEIKKYKDNLAEAKQTYDNYMQLETAKKGAGLAEAKKLQTQIAGTVGEAQAKANNWKAVGEFLNDATKSLNQVEEAAIKAGLKPKTLAPRLTTIEGTDENGKPTPLVVDVNAEGFDPANATIGAPGVIGKAPPKAAQAGVRERSFALRTFTALRGVVQDFKNLLDSPETAAMPALSGIIASDPTTISGSLIALAARDMTPEDERAFQQLSEQIAASLARIEAQGLASGTTQANIRSFDALRPKAGDKAINMALYLARLKQEIDIGLEVFETNTGANDAQMKIIERLKEEVDDILPYTVDDVLKLLPGGQRSLSQSTQALLRQPALFGTIVDNQPEQQQQQFTEGQRSTSRSGRPIIFRNGQWEYE